MLKTKNLQKIFSKDKKIDFADVDLAKNSILFIKGPSGSGKTTLMKIFSKLDKNYKGDLKIDFSENEIGYFFHDYRLISNLSIIENIFFGNIYKNIENTEIKKEIFEIAEKLDISKKLQTNIKKLSSGEYQRICLIRAFIGEKKFFILDEPISHLDEETSKKVYELIFHYYEKGATFVLSSHDEKLFSFLSEKIEKEKIKIIEMS